MNKYSSEENVLMLVSLLKQYGIKRIIISPGTNNVCFAYSVQKDDFFDCYSAPDERSAAYIACGMAAESGEPVVLSCTGATASRNYVSGLTEAYYRKLPVIAVTSTLNRNNLGNGIPQYVDRSQLQKDIAKLSVYIPTIRNNEDRWSANTNINRALLEVEHLSKGPVHIDLETEFNDDFSIENLPSVRKIMRVCEHDCFPEICDKARIGIFIGAHSGFNDKIINYIDKFCEKYDAIVLCDRTSNYFGKYGVMASLISAQEVQKYTLNFDIIIHLGEISGAGIRLSAKEVWKVNNDGKVSDTFKSLKYIFEMSEETFFDNYVSDFLNFDKKIEQYLGMRREYNRLLDSIPDLPFSNIWVAKETSSMLPDNSSIHFSILNSLRSWNFFETKYNNLGYCNVGGFGIDGCMSAMVGASLINKEKLFFGIMGDLAFFYDMNVLGNRHIGNNLRIMLISNGCGVEFKKYDHFAYQLGDAADDYIAAKGHYGNKSEKLVKDLANNLGFMYISAHNKEEFWENCSTFFETSKNESIIFELFIDSSNETKALDMIKKINGSAEDKKLKLGRLSRVPDRNKRKFDNYILWGSGKCFEKYFDQVITKTDIKYICDNNSSKWGKVMRDGITCISPDSLKQMDGVFVIIMVENAIVVAQIINQLLDIGVENFDIVHNWLGY